jgi:hypothetical protein
MHFLILNKQMYNMKECKEQKATELNIQFPDLSYTQHNSYIICKIFMIMSFSQMILKLRYRAVFQGFCKT